jgi:hypothetical protein
MQPPATHRHRATTAATAVLIACLAIAAVSLSTPAAGAAVAPPPNQAQTIATLTPSISPNRLAARAALTLTIHYAEIPFGHPEAVLKSVVRLPAGLSLEIPHLRACSAARLRARGASGCPTQSLLGRGYAIVEAQTGTLRTDEHVTLWAFLGPPQNLEPTVEILGQGYTPLEQRMLFAASVIAAGSPYGEELTMTIPPIPTLPLEPDASIVTLSLTVGASQHRTRASNAVIVPSTCPLGGFPFAAEFTYADGASGSATATSPCPS